MPLVCAEHPAPLHDASCEEFMPYKFVLFALKVFFFPSKQPIDLVVRMVVVV